MASERKEAVDGAVVHHVVRVRDGSLGRIALSIVTKGADKGSAHLVMTSPVATETTLPVDVKFKADFIAALRKALDEWERTG
jgi:hypothetical protein